MRETLSQRQAAHNARPWGTSRAASILVQVTCGPEHPTRAALAFLVAKAAVELALEADRVLAY